MSSIFILVVLTVSQVVLSEFVPKSPALRYPAQVALCTVDALRFSLLIFSPFIWLLNGSSLFVLKCLGVPLTEHRHAHSPREIEVILEHSTSGGALQVEEYSHFREALRLPDRRAHQLMVPRVRMQAVEISTPLDEVLRQLKDSAYTRLPVYREVLDNIIGTVHVKEVVRRYLMGNLKSLKELVRPAVLIPQTITVDRVLETLRQERAHLAIVVDEYGIVRGLLTLEDVLSEILGEVPDEFKVESQKPDVLADGRVRLPGALPRHLVDSWIGREWFGSADTVSGYIVEKIGRLPKVGEQFELDGVALTIEGVQNRVITSVLAVPWSGK